MQKPQIPIFMEITDAEWDEMVRLLCLREKKFKKNTIIFHQGDITEEMGIVIKGNVNIESVDVSGNVSLLGNAEAGDVFAETYALCGEAMAVDAVATSETVILFLPMKQLMHEKNAGYLWYGKMQANNPYAQQEKSGVVKSYFLYNAEKNPGSCVHLSFHAEGEKRMPEIQDSV